MAEPLPPAPVCPVDLGVVASQRRYAVLPDELHQDRRIDDELFQVIIQQRERHTDDVGLTLALLDAHTSVSLVAELEDSAVRNVSKGLEPFDGIVARRFVVRRQSASQLAIVELRDLVVDADFETATVSRRLDRESVGKVELSFVELDPVPGLVVKTFELLRMFESRVLGFLFSGYVIVTDA